MATPDDITFPANSGYLAFLHCNTQSARNKADELRMLISKFLVRFHVIMLTETWYSCESDVLRLPGYQSYYLNRCSRRGGGVLQLVSEEMLCTLLPQFTQITPDYEALTLEHAKYLFVVVYRPPDGCVSKFFGFLSGLLNFADTNNFNVIIGGDCNINMLQNTASTRDFKILLDSFHCANVIKEHTRITCNSSTLLDLFITNNSENCVKSGTIISGVSDHLPVYMLYKHKSSLKNRTSKSESYTVQDINIDTLDAFRYEMIKINWNPVYECTSAEEAYNVFMSLLKFTYLKCFKFKRVKKSKKLRKPWMTHESYRLIKEKDALFAKFVKTKNPRDLSKFRKFRNHVTKYLRSTKNAYFENLFNGRLGNSDLIWREINKLLNKNSYRQDELELKIDNALLKGKELAHKFNTYFTTLVSPQSNVECHAVKQFLDAPNLETVFLEPTCPEEIHSTFTSLKNSRARDIDDIEIRPIKYTLDILSPVLSFIFNLCLSTGTFPTNMQRARVTVIFKSGNRNSFSNYRPISILPVISKGLEKIIFKRVSCFCQKHSLLSPKQFGFRSGMSTEMPLLTQKEFILTGFENKLLTLGVYIDFSKAFDRINHRILAVKLEHYGFRGISLGLLMSYLKHRKQCVVIDENRSSLLEITSGVPQGSILGPLLFNIYVNDITKLNKNAECIMYADDTTLLLQSTNVHDLTYAANIELLEILKWTEINCLEINGSKTKAVLFTPVQNIVNRNLSLHLGSENIEVVQEVKTLGVIFHQHLNWNTQVDHVAKRLSKACGVLCKFRQVLPSKVKLLLYNSMFAPHINYCNLVWGNTSQGNINKLVLLQKKAIRHIANASYDAHTAELFQTLNVLPLQHSFQFNLIMKYKHSLKCKNELFLKLCNLRTPHEYQYNVRNRHPWLIPFSRTNHGFDRLEHCMPTYLEHLQRQEIDLCTITKKELKRYLTLQNK